MPHNIAVPRVDYAFIQKMHWLLLPFNIAVNGQFVCSMYLAAAADAEKSIAVAIYDGWIFECAQIYFRGRFFSSQHINQHTSAWIIHRTD